MYGNRCTKAVMAAALASAASAAPSLDDAGPYNARFLEGGIGIERPLPADAPVLAAGAAFTFSAWVRPTEIQPGVATLMALGETTLSGCRCIVLDDGRPAFMLPAGILKAPRAIAPSHWTHLAATSDGAVVQLYVDGRQVARAALAIAAAAPTISIAPARATLPRARHFGGALVGAAVEAEALGASAIAAAAHAPPAFDLVHMHDVGVGWVWQKQANIGLFAPQDAWTLPQGKGGFSAPVAKPPSTAAALEPRGAGRWQVNAWRLIEAPGVTSDGATLSRPGVDVGRWYPATVPGTVLTTLIDRGVYPDPYFGLNNLAIPEKLARQDYWYRTSFTLPPETGGQALRLRFGGINYAAETWINGRRMGTTRGAFTRGDFAFDAVPGENIVAVRVGPPPHPGIPHEQSIRGGVGENGGQLAIDGPTFVATEGWDWIPGIRDRNTGLWQPVELLATGPVRLLDPRIVTDLPLPRVDSADIYIDVPVANDSTVRRRITVTAGFDDVRVSRTLDVAPGESVVRFAPATDPALRLGHPRLWWPNGYGEAALHQLTLTATSDGTESDRKMLRFGIREVSYELSLFDSKGKLRRVEVAPTDGMLRGERLVDVRHTAIKATPEGWVESLTPAGESSPAVRDIAASYALPHLALRVNGVRIAARGGSWGMDDALKRVSRDRLAPYFRLECEAHMNIIRNWMGNNSEPEFYDLADENGMMVLNDFWQSTQDFQVEPQDPALFLANMRDTVKRYRNHPSIVVWFGRNEGVPYPLLNEGMDDVIAELDGTRWFTGSSNNVNLQGSGPYNYRPPEGYFTDLASGFSVETGTPSLSTLGAIEASVPAADRWPLSDTLAYHDWHFSGNGDSKTFMAALDTMFGPATSLADFERKAQMMNLETHKAIYEGFLGHLWTKNSGRLLWMTHPSWPSNSWQLYSSDYDTSAAYYGAKHAAEPIHVQLNLPGNELVVVNTTRNDVRGLRAEVRVNDLAGRALFSSTQNLDAPANQTTIRAPVPLAGLFARSPMLLVSLRLSDAHGALLSDNLYWRGRDPAAYRALGTMADVPIDVASSPLTTGNGEGMLALTLRNTGTVPALNTRVTLLDAQGARILPAYYTDNYIGLLPGERRTVEARFPLAGGVPRYVSIDGWNVATTRSVLP